MQVAAMLAAVAGMGACASGASQAQPAAQPQNSGGGLFGLFGSGERAEARAEIGVNSFLWRATLDTLSFMPIERADSNGGLIVTEWWTAPSAPGEWLKVQVYILDTRLRADALSVSVLRRVGQTLETAVNQEADNATNRQLENAILTRARLLRLQTVGG
jgi:hypothetical protein